MFSLVVTELLKKSMNLKITKFYCFQGKGALFCCLFFIFFLIQSCEEFWELTGSPFPSPHELETLIEGLPRKKALSDFQ